MRDTAIVRDDGTVALVSEMPRAEIVDYLRNGFVPREGSTKTREDLIERLLVELVIRAIDAGG
jgi:hypothetical protein